MIHWYGKHFSFSRVFSKKSMDSLHLMHTPDSGVSSEMLVSICLQDQIPISWRQPGPSVCVPPYYSRLIADFIPVHSCILSTTNDVLFPSCGLHSTSLMLV